MAAPADELVRHDAATSTARTMTRIFTHRGRRSDGSLLSLRRPGELMRTSFSIHHVFVSCTAMIISRRPSSICSTSSPG
jgi:hypothetical protein